jgi:hypothetical protein
MPVIRHIHWPALIPQALAIAALSAVAWFLFPTVEIAQILLIGAAAYLVFCVLLRLTFARDHSRGMAAYRAGQFQDAIAHFEASRRFFSAHPHVDACRSLLFGAASMNAYRTIALGNMAYCYGQLGDGPKAIGLLYEQLLREVPDHAVAKAEVNMLRAATPRVGAEKSARFIP